VDELQATRQHAGEAPREQRLPITTPLRGGRLVLPIDGQGSVVMRLAGCAAQGLLPGRWLVQLRTQDGLMPAQWQGDGKGVEA
jgi:hypothetical protein